MQQRRIFLIGIAAFLCLGLGAAALLLPHFTGISSGSGADREVIFQVGTFDAILQSAYDGAYAAGNLTKLGDFGIGTLDALDGELIVLDGQVFDVRSDGVAYLVPPNATTPFATVTFFDPDIRFTVPEAGNLTVLAQSIDRKLPSPNLFYAVKIRGTFPFVEARSVPRQHKPYPRLVDAVADQSVFGFRNVTGTVVGFITPAYVKGINVPGYHLHFITEDRTGGGHILDLQVRNAAIEIDTTNQFAMFLPTGGAFTTTSLGGDLTSDMEIVEKGGAGSSNATR
jgi:acetolactate decarboxylase